MPQKTTKNTFMKGMNLDADISYQPKGTYRECEEFRVVVDNDGTMGSLSNVKGNTNLNLGLSASSIIIGSATIDDYIVLLVFDAPNSYIYKVTFVGEVATLVLLWNDEGHATADMLLLDPAYPIKAVTRRETTDIDKVYWVDNTNYLRYANIAEYLTTDKLIKSASNDYVSAKTFSTVADVTFTDPVLLSSGGGGLNAGVVQYAYQLYNKNGSESSFSPATGLYHLASASDNASDNRNYKGNTQDEETGKSFTFDITLTTYAFDSIRIVSIFYDYYSQLPTINIINEKRIPGTGVVRFTDTGTGYIGSYTVEQFTAISGLYKAKDIASSKNYLFLANTTENYFDIGDYDARAYRFRNYESIILASSHEGDGFYYEVNDVGDWLYKNASNVTLDSGSDWSVPENANLINWYNDPTNDSGAWAEFKYQSDGTTKGGLGKNIEYTFSYNIITLDDDEYSYVLRTNAKDTTLGYNNFCSPNKTANERGYQFDETYRFGIIFFDQYGRESVVKWIGDIRMPSIKDGYLSIYSSGITKGRTVTPVFTINDFPEGATTYKIVRVERNTEDKSIVASGIVRPTLRRRSAGNNRQTFHTFPDDDMTTTSWIEYDLQEFISPEISFYKNLQVLGDDYIEIHDAENMSLYDPANEDVNPNDDWNIKIKDINAGAVATTLEIAEGAIVRPLLQDESINIAEFSFYGYYDGDEDFHGIKGTSLIFKPEVATDIYNVIGSNEATDKYIRYGIYRRKIQSSQYGGNTHSARSSNEYVAAGPTERNNSAVPPTISTNRETIDIDMTSAEMFGDVARLEVTQLLPASNRVSMRYHILYNDVWRKGFVSVEAAPSGLDISLGYKPSSGATDYDSTGTDTITIISYLNNTVGGYSLDITYESTGDIYDGNEPVYLPDILMCTAGTLRITYDVDTETDPGTPGEGNESTANYGDTFVAFHEQMALSFTDTSGDHVYLNIMFPVESSLNLNLRHDDRFSTIFRPGSKDYQNLREEGVVDGTVDYSEMYLYNTVYSQENTLKTYFPLPEDEEFENFKEFNTRIVVSEKKFNGEASDSWLSFLTNNFIDVDANYGELTNIMDYNNNLLYWQPRAFGLVDVDPRSLITDNNPGALVLGTGAVLSRFDNLSTLTGNSDLFGLTKTSKGVYWYDNINQIIIRYNGKSIERLSKLLGVQSHLNAKQYITSYTAFDQKYDEVLFSLKGSTDKTLVFNELSNAFTGFYNIDAVKYIELNSRLLSSDDNNDLYLHDTDTSEYGVYYGTATPTVSTIKIPINETIDIVKVFDAINYTSYSADANDILNYDDTFDTVRCYNSYQNTNYVTLTPGTNVSRKKGMWSLNIPRNMVNVDPSTNPDIFLAGNLTGSTPPRPRIRDTYMLMDLTYNNINNYRFNVPFVHTKYRANFR